MDFCVLGDLEIRDQGRALPLSDGKQKALLAALLLDANHVVHADTLIDVLWGSQASPKAASNLHALVSRLRRTIGTDRLERHGAGYLLRVGQDELDVHRFERLRAEARHAIEQGEPAAAAATLREALEIWRGPPLSDFTYDSWAANEIRRLEEHRLVAFEERIEAELAAARHAEIAGELQSLVAEHPLRETFRGQLIVALYRSGRQAEALEAYREARRVLDEELGLEPGPTLRDLEQAVLRQDSSLELQGRAGPPDHQAPVPGRVSHGTRLGLAATVAVLAFATTASAILVLRDDAKKAAAAAPKRGNDIPSATAPVRETVSRTPARPRAKPKRAEPKAVRRVLPPSRAGTRVSAPRPPARRTRERPASRVTTTTPSQRKATPKKKPALTPPPTPPVRLADTFDDGVMNRSMWHEIISGTGVTVVELNDRLELSIAGDAAAGGQYNVIDGHWGTQCRFLGDFDVRVDFDVLEWPPTNGVSVQLAAWFQSGGMTVGRQSRNWDQGEGYTSYAPPGWNAVSAASDLSGGLRIRRQDRDVATYYRRGGGWERLLHFTAPRDASGVGGSPVLGLQATSTDEAFGDLPVRVAFDNFVVTAEQAAC